MEQAFNKDIDDAFAYAEKYLTALNAVPADNGRNDRLQNT